MHILFGWVVWGVFNGFVCDVANQAGGSRITGKYFQGGLSGDKTLKGTIWNFRQLKVSGERHQLTYANSLNATEADLLNKESFFSNNAFPRSSLINGGRLMI